jgi:PKD repeat protein
MASNIRIYETQSVIYTDTTSGGLPPYSRRWTFTGGNIASATGATALVRYNNPGSYTATLTVTDFNNVTNSFTATNGIEVLASSVSASFTRVPASILMDQTTQFTDTSIGSPQAPTSFQWDVGGSSYSTAQNPTLEYQDWALVPGAALNANPGASVSVAVELTATSSYASDSETSSITVTKTGQGTSNTLNKANPGASVYTQEVSITGTSQRANSYGYPTASYIFQLDYSAASLQAVSGFHSTQEDAYILMTGLGGNPGFVTDGVASVNGYLVIEDALYKLGVPAISVGRYIWDQVDPVTGRNVDKLFFADDGTSGNITDLITNTGYTESIVASIMNNRYPQLNSTQSDYWSPSFPLTTVSTTGKNPVVYSTTYFTNRFITGVNYEVYIDINSGSSTITCTFNANSGQGNEKSGNNEYYVMQDVAGIDGVVTQLNAAITATLGSTNEIEFTAVQNFNINSSGTPADYYGLKMEVKDTSIESVTIKDNSATLNSIYSLSLAPFTYRYNNGATGIISCTGMPSNLNLGFGDYIINGKSIYYGGTIF